MSQDNDLYSELAFYTLAHRDPAFIHQHAADAYTAQSADEATRPITLTFALVGLYLHLEKGYTGKQVQQAHMRLANKQSIGPGCRFPPVEARSALNTSSPLLLVLIATP